MANKKKKRKVNYLRLAVLGLSALLVCLLSITLVVFVAKKVVHKKDSKKDQVVDEKEINITLIGDLFYEQGLYDWMDHYSFGSYADEVKPLIKSDFTIANQEVPIGGEALGVTADAYVYNAPETVAKQYKSLGIDYVTCANNHTFDMGDEGIANMNKTLDECGIGHTGAYTSEEEQNKIDIVDVNGIKIAILAYTYGSNQPLYTPYATNTFLNAYGLFDEACQEKLENDVREAQEKADMVIVAMHWGTEYTYYLEQTQADLANFLNELGVDVIFGSHPQSLQPAETLTNSQGKDTVVFYSLGNFISSTSPLERASEDASNMYQISGVAKLKIIKNDKGVSVKKVHLVPIVNHFEQNYTNFKLIPFYKYTEAQAEKHMQRESSANFSLDWIATQIHYLYDSTGFIKEDLS